MDRRMIATWASPMLFLALSAWLTTPACHAQQTPPPLVITAPKEVIIMPKSGHTPVGDSQAPYYSREYGAWLPALKLTGHAPILENHKNP